MGREKKVGGRREMGELEATEARESFVQESFLLNP